MTPREQAAFNAGVEAARQMALVAAVSLEIRDDAQAVRQKAASAALQGFADGAKVLLIQAEPVVSTAVSNGGEVSSDA